MNESDVKINTLKLKKGIKSKELMWLWQECQDISEHKGRIGLLFKIKSMILYRITDWNFYKIELSKIITTFQGLFYKIKHDELCNDINKMTEYLNSTKNSLMEDLCTQSMMILKDTLAKKYMGRGSREKFSEEDLWKNSSRILEEYPIVLSTTFSSKSSLNNEVVYDYLIMDEASQVDLATGALALSCARNAVIVGDTKQLPNVVTENIRQQSRAIFNTYHISEGYQFTKSFLQSVLEVIPSVTQILLREHYRCHPKIINFCNQKFYNGELIIMTEDKGENDVLTVMKTVKGNHVREHYSQRQIDVIKNEIIPQFVNDKSETGIIAPYKNQVVALDKEFLDIDVATVHKFQGREKDTIIISTVDDEITDFVDDPYLLNVAVSRAKKKLTLVVSGNEQLPERNISELIAYIQYNNFEVLESKIYSVFDYLYKQYADVRQAYLKKYKKISDFDSENLMYALITQVLKMDSYGTMDVVCHLPLNMLIRDPKLLNDKECNYAMNPAAHLDFLIFNRISKQPILAVEVDGYGFHKDGTIQSERDALKNHIMELYEIPMVRFETNGSREKEIIISKLEELVVGIN